MKSKMFFIAFAAVFLASLVLFISCEKENFINSPQESALENAAGSSSGNNEINLEVVISYLNKFTELQNKHFSSSPDFVQFKDSKSISEFEAAVQIIQESNFNRKDFSEFIINDTGKEEVSFRSGLRYRKVRCYLYNIAVYNVYDHNCRYLGTAWAHCRWGFSSTC